jgi:hypothetical protein
MMQSGAAQQQPQPKPSTAAGAVKFPEQQQVTI